jgi:DNA-binding transcriptional ArsR family regulator
VPYSNSLLVTIAARQIGLMSLPMPIDEGEQNRETSMFHLVSESSQLSIVGTFDEIIEFATDIMVKMMTWPIVTQHREWLTEADMVITREAGNGNGS